MPVFQFIANLKTSRKFANLDQEQNEALIDLLTAAKAIDGELRKVEQRELLEVLDMLEWSGDQTMARYVEDAVERAQELEPVAESLQAFFADIGQRLGAEWLREEGYFLASRIALADAEVVEQERLFLKHLVKAFEIPSDRQQTIIGKLEMSTVDDKST